jgi:hypothetical protein
MAGSVLALVAAVAIGGFARHGMPARGFVAAVFAGTAAKASY